MNEPATGTGKKPKGSTRRLYTDENPRDTVSIKYASLKDTQDTIKKLERLYKSDRRPHIRISQIANVLEQRLRFIKSNNNTRHKLAKRYTEFLKERTKKAKDKDRQRMKFAI